MLKLLKQLKENWAQARLSGRIELKWYLDRCHLPLHQHIVNYMRSFIVIIG